MVDAARPASGVRWLDSPGEDRLNQPLKATVVTAGVVVLIALVVLIVVLATQRQAPPAGDAAPAPELIRSDSHVLDQGGDGAVTVVEFLDFECEVCGAFYPVVEDLRERFRGDITYVLRYFPIPSHFNSMNAAIAAEAAARQGRLEDMYRRLFESQAEWGEQGESRADVFRGFAVELGLDMARYDADVADPATRARVEQDFEDGRALGVDGTPTFFVDGARLELRRFTDVADAVERALAGAAR